MSTNLVLSLILVLVFCPGKVSGATIHVPGDQPTIQAGIQAASNGDTVLVADGTYVGGGNRDLDFNGKAITVESENGPAGCITDCEGAGRGFHFDQGEGPASVVSGLTIVNGDATVTGGDPDGGGVFCDNDSGPTITNCTFSNNDARHAGGIFCYRSSPTITECTFTDNEVLYHVGKFVSPVEYLGYLTCGPDTGNHE